MYEITWTNDCMLGIPTIDQEHQALVDAFNALYDSSKQGSCDFSTVFHFARFTQLLEDHFEHEEQEMQTVGFPGLRRHKKLHTVLLREQKDAQRLFMLNPNVLAYRTLLKLRTALYGHMIEDDMLFGQWLQMTKAQAV